MPHSTSLPTTPTFSWTGATAASWTARCTHGHMPMKPHIPPSLPVRVQQLCFSLRLLELCTPNTCCWCSKGACAGVSVLRGGPRRHEAVWREYAGHSQHYVRWLGFLLLPLCRAATGWWVHGTITRSQHEWHPDPSLPRQRPGTFAAWDDVAAMAEALGIPTAPLVFRGQLSSLAQLEALMVQQAALPSRVSSQPPEEVASLAKESTASVPSDSSVPTPEGFVVRVAAAFGADEFGSSMAKFVRAGHVQTDARWRDTWKKASLHAHTKRVKESK